MIPALPSNLIHVHVVTSSRMLEYLNTLTLGIRIYNYLYSYRRSNVSLNDFQVNDFMFYWPTWILQRLNLQSQFEMHKIAHSVSRMTQVN